MNIVKFINNIFPKRLRGNGGWVQLVGQAASTIGDAASKNGGSGGGGFGQVFSNVGNRDVKNKTAKIGMNLMDFGGGLSNTLSAFGLGNLFGGKEGEDELEDARTPEQKAAAAALQQLAMSGSFDGINLGELYGGQLGSYDTSGQQAAYDQLMSLYSGQDISTARDVYTKLSDTTFNPDDPSSGYAAFSRQLARAGQESSDVLNREAAMTGSRFGTGIQKQKADLAAQMQDQRGSYLAQLYNQQQNRALQAAGGLQGLAGVQSNIAQQASLQAGMINEIKDQQAKDMYNDYKRARAEDLSRISLLQTESNRNPYLGVDLSSGNTGFSDLANSLLGSMAKSSTSEGGWLSNLFSGNRTATVPTSNVSLGTASDSLQLGSNVMMS